MNKYFAILAEDKTDCDTVRKIIHRVLGKETKTKSWSAKGCANLKKGLSKKLKSLSNEGCNVFIIVHDLDRNNESQLRQILEKEAAKVEGINQHICIPIEELEAWFWSDPEVIEDIGKGKGKAHPNPSQIIQPKEKLIALSVGENRKPRYSINMNVELAERLNLELCSQRCPSFKNLLEFLKPQNTRLS